MAGQLGARNVAAARWVLRGINARDIGCLAVILIGLALIVAVLAIGIAGGLPSA